MSRVIETRARFAKGNIFFLGICTGHDLQVEVVSACKEELHCFHQTHVKNEYHSDLG